jgi:hypothetical protein
VFVPEGWSHATLNGALGATTVYTTTGPRQHAADVDANVPLSEDDVRAEGTGVHAEGTGVHAEGTGHSAADIRGESVFKRGGSPTFSAAALPHPVISISTESFQDWSASRHGWRQARRAWECASPD